MIRTLARVDDAIIDDLLKHLTGLVATPADADYGELVRPWNLATDPTPALAVEAREATDVVRAVHFAGEAGLAVAVQASGHGIAADLDGAVLVNTRRLDECVVRPEGWARVGAGVKWAQATTAAAPHGLAGVCGSAAGVGVVGYTTGAGQGPISRTYGLASDHVRAAELVTGDGALRRVSADQEPDLFWAVRGGKGAVGIVTALEFDLLALPTVYGGALYFAGADIARALHAWAQWCPTLPEQATTSVAVLRLPAVPGVPEPLAGRPTLAMRFVWTGDPDDGAKVIAPMRAVAEPVIDAVAAMPFSDIARVHNDPVDPLPSRDDAEMLRELPPAAVDALLGVAGPELDLPLTVVEIRQFGGAIAREPALPSAVCHRDAAFSINAIGPGAPPVVDAVVAAGAAVMAAMQPWTHGGLFPNFCPGAGDARLARSYDAPTLARLKSIADAYDPQRVFRVGQVPDR
jgi:FAD/FMN-containing dehydrogenase